MLDITDVRIPNSQKFLFHLVEDRMKEIGQILHPNNRSNLTDIKSLKITYETNAEIYAKILGKHNWVRTFETMMIALDRTIEGKIDNILL